MYLDKLPVIVGILLLQEQHTGLQCQFLCSLATRSTMC